MARREAHTDSLSDQFRLHFGHHENLYGIFLDVLADDLDAGGVTAQICRDHLSAARGDAIQLRLLAGIHRLVLRGAAAQLAPWYGDSTLLPSPERAREALLPLLATHAEELRHALDLPPQTNEVGRSACLLLGLFEAVRRHGLRRVRLLEPGASAGLNLNVDRYRFTGPDWSWGPSDGLLTLDTGAAGVRPEDLVIAQRRGCDLVPVDVTDPDGERYLASFVWPFDRERHRRLTAAIDAMRTHPVTVDRAPASTWLATQLAAPTAEDVVTVVWQSITQQYWPAEESAAVRVVVDRARTRTPLVHVTMEGVPPRLSADGYRIREHGPELRVDGDLIARSHHHGPPVYLLGS